MVQATFHFPRGFLWGSATAAYQVEGNTTNSNWWAWEQQEGRIAQNHKSGLACDWWNGRWREDFDRASESGQNALRLSVEWSRVQPAPDRWDEDALDRYREMMRGLVDRGLTPLVTLHHYTDPIWLSEQGGWENDATVELFEKYTRKVVEALKDYATYWVTINEPNAYIAHSYILGDFPPEHKNIRKALLVGANLARGHAAAYHVIHKIQPQARVGLALLFLGFQPARDWSPLDKLARNLQFRIFNEIFPRTLADGIYRTPLGNQRIPVAKGTQDFLGINYYMTYWVAFNLLKPNELFGRRFFPAGSELSDTGMINNYPQGIFRAIQWGRRFNLPILITENGVEDADDHLRPRYLIQHLHQVWRAVNFNIPVKGYFHWTLVDNFEWQAGWTRRFGLWELDLESQARRKRPSADLYAKICRANGISTDMITLYAPGLLEAMFPG